MHSNPVEKIRAVASDPTEKPRRAPRVNERKKEKGRKEKLKKGN